MTRLSMILLAFLGIATVAAAEPVGADEFTPSDRRRRVRLDEAERDTLQALIDRLFGRSRSRWGWKSIDGGQEPRGHVLPAILPWLGKGAHTYPGHVFEGTRSITILEPPATSPAFLRSGFDPPGTPEPIPNPEPGTLLLIGMGAAGIAYRNRRRARG